MIPIQMATEPDRFEQEVRRPGLDAINELVGLPPIIPRPGRRRERVATDKSQIPSDKFPPFWRRCIDDMMVAYEQRCAYLAMHIEYTGHPTVDHVIPKSLDWQRVYEWQNYRLCAGIVNAKKGDLMLMVDPVDAAAGWFELNLSSFSVVRGANAPVKHHVLIDTTLPMLNLRDCVKQRQQYFDDYMRGPFKGGIDINYLTRRAPFIALELRRQGRLARDDS